MTMLYTWENTTREVERAKPDMALLPLAAMEQHGEHLPVGTKILLLSAIARRVGAELPGPVYLLPTLPLGTSDSHVGTAGTIALSWETLAAIVSDLVVSLLEQGVQKVAVLVGLGSASAGTVRPAENEIAKTAVRQLNHDHPELQAIWAQPLGVAGRDLLDIFDTADREVHAGEVTTSLMLHLHPELVRGKGQDHEPGVDRAYLNYGPFTSICPEGVWGHPSQASAEKGGEALEIIVHRTTDYISGTFDRLAAMKRDHQRLRRHV